MLVSDIERGGCFASIYGTIKLVKVKHQRLFKGFIINKFRGDDNILREGLRFIEYNTKMINLGVIPKIEIFLPPEDSLDVINDNSFINIEKLHSKKQLEKQIVRRYTIRPRHNNLFVLLALVNGVRRFPRRKWKRFLVNKSMPFSRREPAPAPLPGPRNAAQRHLSRRNAGR